MDMMMMMMIGGGCIADTWKIIDGLKPILMMVLVQSAYAGVNIFYKLAANDGMNLRVLIAYRFVFAAAFMSPTAFFLERKRRPKLTWTVLGQAFLCGLLGGSLNQNLYVESLALTSATFASAMTNLIPAATFILAILVGLEKLAVGTMGGKAKIYGTVTGIVGAMVLTAYKGTRINLWSTNNYVLKHHNPPPAYISTSHHRHDDDHVVGALFSLCSCLSYASWLIIQARIGQRYPYPYSSTALLCIMGSIQAIIFALCMERDWKQWKLGWNVRLLTVAYGGIFASALTVTLIAWCIRLRGPLFVSAFNPLLLIFVAIAGSLILDEKLYVGSVIGAILIMCGLYMVLWGKGKEMKTLNILMQPIDRDSNSLQKTRSSTVHDRRKGSCTGSDAPIADDIITSRQRDPGDEV